jgi:hypothetical protein
MPMLIVSSSEGKVFLITLFVKFSLRIIPKGQKHRDRIYDNPYYYDKGPVPGTLTIVIDLLKQITH